MLLQSRVEHCPGVAALVQQPGGLTAIQKTGAVTDKATFGMFAGLVAKSRANPADEGFKGVIMKKRELNSDDQGLCLKEVCVLESRGWHNNSVYQV